MKSIRGRTTWLGVFIFLTFAYRILPAGAESICHTLFRPVSQNVSWRPAEPLSFGEIFAANNDLTSTNPTSVVALDPVRASWVIDSQSRQLAQFTLKLRAPFKTMDPPLGQMPHMTRFLAYQDVGGGLNFKIKTNQLKNRARIRLVGHSRSGHLPFVAEATILIQVGQSKVNVPWEHVVMTKDVSLNPTPALEFRTFHSRGLAKLSGPLPDQSYTIAKGELFDPALFEIDSIHFDVESDKTGPLHVELGNEIYRDFSLDYIEANKSYLEEVLELRLLLANGTGFIDHALKQYRNPEAIEWADKVVDDGHAAIEKVLESYEFKMKEISGKVTDDRFFTEFIGHGLIPIETGDFATYHDRYAHVKQLLVLLHGTPNKYQVVIPPGQTLADISKTYYTYRLSRIFSNMTSSGPLQNRWRNVWNILFDAPGDQGPNAPRWWVKRNKDRARQ
jgi:hypothetical protein